MGFPTIDTAAVEHVQHIIRWVMLGCGVVAAFWGGWVARGWRDTPKPAPPELPAEPDVPLAMLEGLKVGLLAAALFVLVVGLSVLEAVLT